MCFVLFFKILKITPYILDSIVVCPRERVAFVFSASVEDNTQQNDCYNCLGFHILLFLLFQFVDLFMQVDDVEGDSRKYGKNDSFLFRMVVLVVLRVQSYDIFFN